MEINETTSSSNDGHKKHARMRVVKNLMTRMLWVWGDVQPMAKPECRYGFP